VLVKQKPHSRLSPSLSFIFHQARKLGTGRSRRFRQTLRKKNYIVNFSTKIACKKKQKKHRRYEKAARRHKSLLSSSKNNIFRTSAACQLKEPTITSKHKPKVET